mgnify:CR=1 FL=1
MSAVAQGKEAVVKDMRMFFEVSVDQKNGSADVKRTTTALVNGKAISVEDRFFIVKSDRNSFIYVDADGEPL